MQESAEIQCPYCGQRLEVAIDPSVRSQCYLEDCQVCCRPMEIHVSFADGAAEVSVQPSD
ncbi:MAG: CPXCG motif-containing cysteine-rich protein [Acidobacteria bacterium]|nr:CPXCG motif-containing cysteine-rich protein [Acidobacteriota bacterium]